MNGTVETFDEQSFKAGLAALLHSDVALRLDASDIRLNVTAASVHVDATIIASSVDDAILIASALSVWLAAPTSIDGLGAVLEGVHPPPQVVEIVRDAPSPPPPLPPPPSPPHRKPTRIVTQLLTQVYLCNAFTQVLHTCNSEEGV